ncbi:MAG: NAD(P)-dependent oxidoreductase [Candidatus Sungbacteria bacterium]|nr:NAD(P)-dependent oxidoreductase [Candidatus Sungbacteria bacterium]
MKSQSERPRRFLLTGAGGLVGKELIDFFHGESGIAIIPLAHADCDITDADAVKHIFARINPDGVINCAVILNVDQCEAEPKKCFAVNRDGVRNLLDACADLLHPVTFVQVSSSEVFGRVHEGEYVVNGYREDDEPRPASAYQKSKREAEILLEGFAAEHPEAHDRWYICRGGWLYGAGRSTFVEQFLEKLQRKEEIKAVRDQWRSPTWTKHFTHGLITLLAGNYPSGVYHSVNEVKPGEATTLDVIDEIRTYLGERCANPPLALVSRDELFKVPRAPSNVLLNTKLPKLPYWKDALWEYLMTHHPLLS